MAQNNTVQIKHVIQTLSQEFALSQHPHSRKGGLIGLAACSIALGKVGLSPGGTDTPSVALTLTPEPHQGVAVLYFIYCTPQTSKAGSVGPGHGPYPRRWTCKGSPSPVLTQRPEHLQGSQGLGPQSQTLSERLLLLSHHRTRGST